MEEQRAINRLKQLNIEPESELGVLLIKLDKVYANIERIKKEIEYLRDKSIQLTEDAEVMELLLMHKFNKDTRINKWDLKK